MARYDKNEKTTVIVTRETIEIAVFDMYVPRNSDRATRATMLREVLHSSTAAMAADGDGLAYGDCVEIRGSLFRDSFRIDPIAAN